MFKTCFPVLQKNCAKYVPHIQVLKIGTDEGAIKRRGFNENVGKVHLRGRGAPQNFFVSCLFL
jgi:hypothetical protein